jgi:hypothetical protein
MTIFIRNAANLEHFLPKASRISDENEDLKNILYAFLGPLKIHVFYKVSKVPQPNNNFYLRGFSVSSSTGPRIQ